MLQKCAYAMISQQELSGQQVASYLMDFEDHFTSHVYRNLYWTGFQRLVNRQLPSPECYPVKNPSHTLERVEQVSDDHSDGVNAGTESHEDTDDDLDEEEVPFLNDFVDVNGGDESASDTNLDDDQEIGVSVDGTGKLVPMAGQLADYQKRGLELSDVCFQHPPLTLLHFSCSGRS
jgi:hypothetical protein